MKAASARRLEAALFVTGGLLLAFAIGATLIGRLQKERALRRFREALTVPVPRAVSSAPAPIEASHALGTASAADTSLWAPERVKAFEESLREKTDAPLAILRVPKVGLEVPLFEGTDELTLNRGAGLIEGTARPDELGNVGIAGHRDGFFRVLMDVKTGDTLELQTLRGRKTYEIASIRIVSPDDVSVLDATSESVVTLVTCYPFYFVGSAPQRYIIRAVASPPARPRDSSVPVAAALP